MAAKPVEIKVHGGTALVSGSRRLVRQISAQCAKRFLTVADHAAIVADTRVPKKTGRLAGSIKTSTTDRSALLRMGQGVPYAGWIEFGGSRSRPFVKKGRYIYPTALESAPQAELAARSAAVDEIRGFTWPSLNL